MGVRRASSLCGYDSAGLKHSVAAALSAGDTRFQRGDYMLKMSRSVNTGYNLCHVSNGTESDWDDYVGETMS